MRLAESNQKAGRALSPAFPLAAWNWTLCIKRNVGRNAARRIFYGESSPGWGKKKGTPDIWWETVAVIVDNYLMNPPGISREEIMNRVLMLITRVIARYDTIPDNSTTVE